MSDKKEIIKADTKSKEDADKSKVSEMVKESGMPKKIAEMFSMTMQSGGLPHQILDKITEKHIDKVLEITDKTNSFVHQDNKSGRRYGLAYAVLAIIVLVVLVWSLKDNNKELLTQILVILASIIGGFGAGYGYCKYKSSS